MTEDLHELDAITCEHVSTEKIEGEYEVVIKVSAKASEENDGQLGEFIFFSDCETSIEPEGELSECFEVFHDYAYEQYPFLSAADKRRYGVAYAIDKYIGEVGLKIFKL